MRRDALTDEQWTLIEPFMPEPAIKGRPRSDLRVIVDGILWIARTGVPWRDLPERFGAWQSVYHWFSLWRRDGTWDRILSALQIRMDAEGRIAWDLWCVDGSNVRASRAAAGAGKKGGVKSRRTMLWAAREAGSAARSIWLLTATACPSPLR
jgi:transposase